MAAARVRVRFLLSSARLSCRHYYSPGVPREDPAGVPREAPTALAARFGPDALATPMSMGLVLPTRFKGHDFDAEACREACLALADSIAIGNHHHVDALMVSLRLMMPPASGAEKAFGRPRDDYILRPEVLTWSKQDFLGGLEENTRIVQECEAKFARLTIAHGDGFRAPEVLAAGLDLAVVYLKNYALDKADALYAAMQPHCMSRGLPWDVKFMQDLATLRCKQNRQADAAVLLEGVAQRTPPHEATLRNLGTVYNMLREHDKARTYFEAASELVGGVEKEDLWNLGIVHMHKKEYEEAAPLLEQALAGFTQDEPDDDVTLAKLNDSLGSCYDDMGRHEDAVVVLSEAKMLYTRSIGKESPLYGTACERLARALVHAGRHREGLAEVIEAFTVIALQDAVHPTPLFELLGVALEDLPAMGSEDVLQLAKLEVPIAAAVRNMHFREIDQDANAGVLFERMARVLVLCSAHREDLPVEAQAGAARRRAMARALLRHADPFVKSATEEGLADLSHITALISMELQTLDAQDSRYHAARRRLGTSPSSASAARQFPI